MAASAPETTVGAPPDTRRRETDANAHRPALGVTSATDEPTVTARIFDADRTDSVVDLDEALNRKLGDRQLLWLDAQGEPDRATADAIGERMALVARTRRQLAADAAPHIAIHGAYVHARVAASSDGRADAEPGWLDVVASRDVVLTVHARPVALLGELDRRIETDAAVGGIDGFAFVRSVLDAVVTSYLRMVDQIEDDIDELDGLALRSSLDADLLSRLVAVRRRIARIRRLLSSQREVFAALRSADFETITEGDDAADFRAVADRFEAALASVEDSRDLLLGSFDLFMTRTAQRTNEVMKVLALATVLLLPGSLVAGLLGMNVDIPLPKDSPWSFWLVVVAIAILAVLATLVARARRWI